MIEYQNCFIGIKINPVVYENTQLAYEILKTNIPTINLIPITTSHITLYFLDDKNEQELKKIIPIIKEMLFEDHTVKILNIKNLNADYFDLIKHLVLIYHVEMNENIQGIYNLLKKGLSHIKTSRVSFVPHLTLGRIYDKESKLYFYENKNYIYDSLDKIKFEFTTSELLLIGRNKVTKEITTIDAFELE
jgi:2'-5' RNA ligase